VVFIGSVNGRVTVPLFAPYSASKHAVEALAETLREEVRPWGIAVSVVEPGMVRTAIWDKAEHTADRLEQQLTPEERELYAAAIAKVRASFETGRRVGVDPDHVARVVEKALTSPRPWSRYLVGGSAKVAGVLDRLLPDRALATVVRRMNV
jgi:NAD(P)-dependent dehydrogenase (short-subunit alcohol dehydrogenase family)